jgi:hypothetical protein
MIEALVALVTIALVIIVITGAFTVILFAIGRIEDEEETNHNVNQQFNRGNQSQGRS